MALSEVFSKVGIFKGLNQDELNEIAALCQEAEFEEGALILRESDKGRDLYLLSEGRVSIEVEMPSDLKGRGKLTTLREGEVFGEMSFITGLRRAATARALDRIRVLVIEGEALNRLFEQNNHMGYVVMRRLAEVLCRRLESTNFMWRNAVMDKKAS